MYWKPVEEEKRSLRHGKITFKVNPNNSLKKGRKSIKKGRKIKMKKQDVRKSPVININCLLSACERKASNQLDFFKVKCCLQKTHLKH